MQSCALLTIGVVRSSLSTAVCLPLRCSFPNVLSHTLTREREKREREREREREERERDGENLCDELVKTAHDVRDIYRESVV